MTISFTVWYSIYKVEKGVIAMNNEEKILELLIQMQMDIAGLKQGQEDLRTDVATLKDDVAHLKQSQSVMQDRIEMIQEDVQITRNAANTLLDWAEQAQVEVKIPLYKKAE